MKYPAILKVLLAGLLMTTVIACEKTQESIVETGQQAAIMLDIDKVSLESVNVRVRHDGDPNMLWSYMHTDDLHTSAQQLLEEKIAKDQDLTGEIVVYVGRNKSVHLSGLKPKCSYRFICGQLDPVSGEIKGKVSEIQFKTRRDPAVFELNTNWTITKGDRIVNNKQEYDSFILDSNDEESYVLVPLKVSDFEFYYSNNMQAFFEDYVSSYGYEVGDNKWKDVVNYGDMTWTEQRLRSGEWLIFMIGIDSEGELTGYYQKLELTIKQEEATAAYNRWLGTWQVYSKDGEALFQIDVLPSENNMWYYMSGWESNNVYGYDTTDPALMPELFFDKETGEMCFISQYVNTMVSTSEAYDFYFSGTFTYGNTYVLGSEVLNYRMADAYFVNDDKAIIEAGKFETQGMSFPIESVCYMYSVGGQLGAISLAPPTLPLTMTKVK